jgi:hypothetical protein
MKEGFLHAYVLNVLLPTYVLETSNYTTRKLINIYRNTDEMLIKSYQIVSSYERVIFTCIRTYYFVAHYVVETLNYTIESDKYKQKY